MSYRRADTDAKLTWQKWRQEHLSELINQCGVPLKVLDESGHFYDFIRDGNLDMELKDGSKFNYSAWSLTRSQVKNLSNFIRRYLPREVGEESFIVRQTNLLIERAST